MNRDEPIVRPGAGAQHVSWFNLEYQLILIIFNVLDDLTVILFTILFSSLCSGPLIFCIHSFIQNSS